MWINMAPGVIILTGTSNDLYAYWSLRTTDLVDCGRLMDKVIIQQFIELCVLGTILGIRDIVVNEIPCFHVVYILNGGGK